MDEGIKIGQIVRDEQGQRYQIIAVAEHEQTRGELMIYQQLFGEFKVMARPIKASFQSAPQYSAQEQAAPSEPPKAVRETAGNIAADSAASWSRSEPEPVPEVKTPAEKTITNLMIEFLDERDINKKQRILDEMAFRPDLTDSVIDNLAAALDIVVDEGPIDLRFSELRSCVRTRAHYELSRFR